MLLRPQHRMLDRIIEQCIMVPVANPISLFEKVNDLLVKAMYRCLHLAVAACTLQLFTDSKSVAASTFTVLATDVGT